MISPDKIMQFEEMMECLTIEEQEVFMMKYYHCMSYLSIAVAMNYPKSWRNGKKIVDKVDKKIKKYLNE